MTPVAETIDPDNFTPRLLILLANALSARESRGMRQRFGLGTNDWRILSALALRPGASATQVADFIEVNKALVSRSVGTLVERGLVTLSDGPRGSRPMRLTPAGVETHNAMLPIAREAERIILAGLSPAEVDGFHQLLRHMITRIRTADLPE